MSVKQEHWVEAIYDETFPASNPADGQSHWGAIGWVNVWGFREGSEGNWTYYACADGRILGIRIADMIVKCKDKKIYDDYIKAASYSTSEFLQQALNDSRINVKRGNNVKIKFVFRWGDEDKSFNISGKGDLLGEEK